MHARGWDTSGGRATLLCPSSWASYRSRAATSLTGTAISSRGLAVGPFLVVGPLALVVRRRHPVAALSVAFAATLGPPGTTTGFLSLIVAFFVAATSGHRRAAWASIAAGFVWSVWLAPLVYQQKAASASFALALGAWLVVLVVVAEAVRMARERRAERQSARELEARRLASEERLRMARDLHDMIGHNISLISIQAGVGLDLMEDQPEQARAALVAIKAVSKEALGELRAMLNALRRDDDDVPRSPAPGLDRLDELVQLTRAAGLSVTTEVVGMPHPLPASVDLAGYRIVQESLTNVARHAPGATATVRIAYKEGAVVVEVVDDGGPSVGNAGPSTGNCGTGTGSGTGSGIAGMKERARALGGDSVTRPRPHGGFEVRARLPLDEIQ